MTLIGSHANSAGSVYNVFEAVDVITLIKGGVYDDLSLPVGEALKKRPAVCLIRLFVTHD